MKCIKCGSEISEEQKFCSNCGHPVHEEESNASQRQAPITNAQPGNDAKKKKGCLFWGLIIVGAIILLGIFAALISPSDNVDKKEDTVSTEVSSSETDTTETQSVEIENTEAVVEEFNPNDYRTDITYDSFARTPDDYEGMKIQMSGDVIQVVEGESEVDLRVSLDSVNEVVYLAYDPSITNVRVLEDDKITFYGVYQGLYTYESTMGASITVPFFILDNLNINNYDSTSVSPTGALREGTYVLETSDVISVAEFTYQDGEAFYCYLYSSGAESGRIYGEISCFLEDNGDGTYTGIIPDEGTVDIAVKDSSIIVTTHPIEGHEMIFDSIDGEYVYQQ